MAISGFTGSSVGGGEGWLEEAEKEKEEVQAHGEDGRERNERFLDPFVIIRANKAIAKEVKARIRMHGVLLIPLNLYNPSTPLIGWFSTVCTVCACFFQIPVKS